METKGTLLSLKTEARITDKKIKLVDPYMARPHREKRESIRKQMREIWNGHIPFPFYMKHLDGKQFMRLESKRSFTLLQSIIEEKGALNQYMTQTLNEESELFDLVIDDNNWDLCTEDQFRGAIRRYNDLVASLKNNVA